MSEKSRYQKEHRLAARTTRTELREAQLQTRENARLERALLPTPLVSDPRLQLLSGYRPSRHGGVLGGDFLDAVELPDGSLHLVIGDVSGHSVDEAALGACLRIAWRTLTLAGSDTPLLLRTLEQVLVYERHDDDSFATLCAITVSPDRSSLEMHLAGHPLPILVDRDGTRLLAGATRPPVGLSLEQEWPSSRVEPDGMWSILLYTDGLIEGHVDGGPERLGADRLVDLVERLRPHDEQRSESFIDELIEHVTALGGGELTDDVAALWMTVSG